MPEGAGIGGLIGGTLLPGLGILPGAALGAATQEWGDDLLGGLTGSRRAQAAAERGQQAALAEYRAALEEQRRMYDQQRADLLPFYQRGLAAIDDYRSMLGGVDWERQRSQAQRNLNAQLSTMGIRRSGFGASAHAGLEADLYQRRLAGLAPLLGLGPGAAGQLTGAGQSMAGLIGQGRGAVAGGLAGLGQIGSQGAMAGFQNTIGLLGALGPLAGLVGGRSGGAPNGFGGNLINPGAPVGNPAWSNPVYGG